MELKYQHEWNVTPKQAISIQEKLRHKIITKDSFDRIKYVAGVDVGFENNGRITRAAIAILEFPSLHPIEVAIDKCKTRFPYVPGLLSFRELPAVIKALDKINQWPDLLLCDGQGLAHPRRFGIACHLGLITNIPSLGVGKTRLIGHHQQVKNEKGAWQPLMDKEECIGAVLRTRNKVKPVYISVGHKICLETALYYVLQCTTRYKLPETTRIAHKYASQTF